MQANKIRVIKNIVSSTFVVLIFALVFISIVNFSCNIFYIDTNVRGFSMQPTINMNVTDPNAQGDKIYINPKACLTNNDIVVAKADWFDNHIIKRLVGVPGDKIKIVDDETHFSLYVNDSVLYTKEKYGENGLFNKTGSYKYYEDYLNFLKNEEFQNQGYVVTENGETYIQLGENDYFLMGDNWGKTTDSITHGPMKKNEIIGKVELVVDVKNDNPFTLTWHMLKKIFS